MARKARPKTKKTSAGKKMSRKPAVTKGKGKAKLAKAVKTATPAGRDALDDMIDAAAKALALKCSPAWMPSIKANLEVILRQAALVDGFALPDEVEPAPVFEA